MQNPLESSTAAAATAGRDPSGFRTPLTHRAATAVARALCAPTLSLDALRHAVIRYAAAARDLAVGPDEMVASLAALVRRCAARRADASTAELQAYVQWWAIHGYHRAD